MRGTDREAWENLKCGILILDLYEDEFFAPGQRYRRRLTADYYGLIEEDFIVIKTNDLLPDRDGRLRSLHDAIWKAGRLVPDEVFDAVEAKAG